MQYFGSNNVEGVADSWLEADMSLVEGDGAGWKWMEGWRWVQGLVILLLKRNSNVSIFH